MLDATRLRTPCLFDKIVSADEAATLITDGMNVGVSGFTPSGYPKKTTLALAKAIKAGKKCRINIWSGASVGPEIEEALAEVGGISGRMPYYAASNKTLSRQINTGSVTYIDQHLSHFAQQIDYGFYGDVDVAIVEAAAINADGSIVLGPGVGNTPMLVKHAKKIIVEVNTSIPLTLEGMHDIYICSKPPERTEIPIYHVGDRIGSPYVSCGLDRITCIVESDIVDHVRNLSAPDEASKKIAAGCIECTVAVYEERHGAVFICSTYGQVVFGVQCVGLNGVYIDIFVQLNLNNFNAVFYILTYADILVTIEVNIIARLYLSSCCYSTINRQIPTFVSVIRCRISSHRRSHACTGHNTCCNQHCQQLFGRAAFTAMIFCDFGDNNISVACFAPNYFKNFVHQKFLPYKYILYNVLSTRCVWEQVKQLLY